jgi:penicillin-binding protein 1A
MLRRVVRYIPQPTARQFLAALLLSTFTLWVLWRRCGIAGCPNVHRLTSYQPGGASILYDAAGDRFADLSPSQHQVVPLKAVPAYVPAAFVAIEDKRFYTHHGVDYHRVGGAVLANIRAVGIAQGFSTITMQLARNVWPDRLPGAQRTLKRKILEIRVARDIEAAFTKSEILELYLNHIYFGEGSYGIEAASRNYFGKSARNLTLSEAATLAAMPKSPVLYNPRRHPERTAARRAVVLRALSAQKLVSSERARQAKSQTPRVLRDAPRVHDPAAIAPYFVEAVRTQLEDEFGEEIYTARLRIYTTLDRRTQRTLEQQLERQARAIERGAYGKYSGKRYSPSMKPADETEYLQTAGIIMRADSGFVLALVGGRDFRQSRFNRAIQAQRQPGSAFKPFVYAAAIDQGILPTQRIADTLHMELASGETYAPKNFDGVTGADVTLREALVHSKNIPTVRLAADIGMSRVRRMARRSGVQSEIPDVPSAAIGSSTVTPLELTQSYTAFATLGRSSEPRFVTRVDDAKGNVLWRAETRTHNAIKPAVAYIVTNMLQEAVNTGTGASVRQAGYRGVAAGKTGTTNDAADAWFVGYTPDYVTTIWYGFDVPKPITKSATGGRLAAPVWGRVMTNVYTTRKKAQAWKRPETVVSRYTDPASGWILTDGCRPKHSTARLELFIRGIEPPTICPAGAPTHPHVNIFTRVTSWMGNKLHRLSAWMKRHIGPERPTEQPNDDRYLGRPRLPEAVEMPDTISPEALHMPLLDSIQIYAPQPPPDTVAMDRAHLDSMILDSLLLLKLDSMRMDTLRRDTLRRDIVRRDTLRRDTIRRDTVRPDTICCAVPALRF